jgi:hypothetical protein
VLWLSDRDAASASGHAQTTVFPTQIATAVQSWFNPQTSSDAGVLTQANVFTTFMNASNVGLFTMVLAAANFGADNLALTGQSGCFITQTSSGTFVNYQVMSNRSYGLCVTSVGSPCTSMNFFGANTGCAIANTGTFAATSPSCSGFVLTPALTYAANACPTRWSSWSNRLPWFYSTVPTVTGNCSSYTYSCTANTIFFGATSANAATSVYPHFTFPLTVL